MGLLRHSRLDWIINGYEGRWSLEAYDSAQERGSPVVIFGPYPNRETAVNLQVINRVILPTRRALRILQKPGAYEKKLRATVVSLAPRDKRKEFYQAFEPLFPKRK